MQRLRNLKCSHGQFTFPPQYEGRKPKIADEKDIVWTRSRHLAPDPKLVVTLILAVNGPFLQLPTKY